MYERNVGGNLGWFKGLAGISLFTDILGFCFDCSLVDSLAYLYGMIYPVIDGNGAFGVVLYIISQFQAWHLSLPKYIVQRGRTNAQFLGYTTLFLVITLHPFCEFIHLSLFFSFFFWTKIRYSDTLVSISSKSVKNNIFVIAKEKVLTWIALYETM